MSAIFGAEEFQQIRRMLDRIYGGSPEENRHPQVESALRERMREMGTRSLAEYLAVLEDDLEEQGALATLLTVGETYFFRTPQHFEAVRDVVLPQLRREGRSHVRVLSAACASGEEPYSFSILMTEAGEKFPWTFEVEAVDVNPAALEKARKGMYSDWSLRSVDEERRHQFFKQQGKQWKLNERIRKSVRFSTANLLRLQAGQFGHGKDGAEGFDIIFCRNALIYFTPAAIKRAIERLRRMLRPGGYLFLGPTETLRGVSTAFQLCHTNETFYYRLSDGEAPEIVGVKHEDEEIYFDPEPTLTATMDTAWFDAIQQSAGRIEAMAGRTSRKQAKQQPDTHTVADILTLVEQDQSAEALRLTAKLPASQRNTQPMRLLRAALLTQTGQLADAIAVCREVLEVDALSTEAHYLLSLALERESPEESRAQAEAAVRLDPDFGMAQMRLAMLQTQAGEFLSARSSFLCAAEALKKEDRRRLALFGGGFSQASLIDMCESEARRLEEKA